LALGLQTAQISLVFMRASSSGATSSRLFMTARCRTVRPPTLQWLISSGLMLASKRSVTRDGQFITNSSSTVKEQELTKRSCSGGIFSRRVRTIASLFLARCGAVDVDFADFLLAHYVGEFPYQGFISRMRCDVERRLAVPVEEVDALTRAQGVLAQTYDAHVSRQRPESFVGGLVQTGNVTAEFTHRLPVSLRPPFACPRLSCR